MLKRLFLTLSLLSVLFIPTIAQDAEFCAAEREIWEIQGNSEEANCNRRRIQLNDNIVTVLSTDGFFIQTPPERSDNDPLTSDGLYIYTDVDPQSYGIQVGDRVNVFGGMQEYYNLTELSPRNGNAIEILSSGNPLPEAIDLATVSLDWVAGVDVHPLERYEGMLVTVNQVPVVAATNRFGEFGISLSGERVFREAGLEIDNYPRFAGRGITRNRPQRRINRS
ncbi:MAG: hypothetical protein Q9P01_08520 [Anaerolineae bacterium]|nr:hypothetical protein [Anaerolineae bacterium]